ncbi:MAG TPA: GYF domain-containing protein, partial [Polyangiaceae bacterium]|nr:GYF domain-containing protein [Polyangiaceae bacterium]
MRISCQSCAAKYTIADEKVVGKVIKIKCKKCSSTIVVNGNDPGALAQIQADGGGFDDNAATKLLSSPPADFGAAAPNPDEWTVSASDDDQRTMTTAQILGAYAAGQLTADSYVWKDGMADWLPIQQVPELAPLLAAAGEPTQGYADPGYADPSAAYAAQGNGSSPYAAAAVAPMAAAAMSPVAA